MLQMPKPIHAPSVPQSEVLHHWMRVGSVLYLQEAPVLSCAKLELRQASSVSSDHLTVSLRPLLQDRICAAVALLIRVRF